MGDKRRSSLLSLLRRSGPKEEKKKEPAPASAFERSVVDILLRVVSDMIRYYELHLWTWSWSIWNQNNF